MTSSYSIDMMIRYAFEYELNNYVKIQKIDSLLDTEQEIVINYLENRIQEFKQKKYPKK
jgi:hypothetical protein